MPAQPAPTPTATNAATARADDVPESWLGRWSGPEGTWMEIARASPGYIITISNLDGPRSHDAVAVPGGLRFERDGVTHTLRATDGAGTGMKWLDGKRDCLTVTMGEGFCRG